MLQGEAGGTATSAPRVGGDLNSGLSRGVLRFFHRWNSQRPQNTIPVQEGSREEVASGGHRIGNQGFPVPRPPQLGTHKMEAVPVGSKQGEGGRGGGRGSRLARKDFGLTWSTCTYSGTLFV